jgi:NAD(P)H-hydrate repair Nnr-like enzyme with NAD(P)H-hydrate dehydratase domain/NAD(P)H-hydrate repair Nnr-like enzyme with NAD(P)H-hydrate epimerase domain
LIRVTSVEQIRAIEKEADKSGYSYGDMMTAAGRTAANRALAILEGIDDPKITVLVGSGNNGGDGLVAGLFIAQDNPKAEVRFYLLSERKDDYVETAQAAGLFIAKAEDDGDKRVLRNMVASADLVIDALFGIGVRLPIEGEAQKILRQANTAINERRRAQPENLAIMPTQGGQIPHAPRLYVLAIDCPSGMDCDTGEVDKNAIHADETITFIAAKTGQFSYPGAEYIGTLTVADIEISEKLKAVKAVSDIVIDAETVKSKLPERGGNSHKGTYGRAMLIAGSLNYIGAPALAAEAAYRSGAGLVTVGTAPNVIQALAGSLREVTWIMLPHDMGVIAESGVDVVTKELSKMQSLLIGPGLGTEKTTCGFLQSLLQKSGATTAKKGKRKLGFQILDDEAKADDENGTVKLPPLVIDADGLNILAEIDEWWKLLPENTILTPHPGEMARLAKIENAEVQGNRWQLAREKAKEWNVILVLKGAHTVIAAPDGNFAVLPFKTDALATAGTGDILAGLIVGMLAQGLKAFDAAVVGAYVHGLAGEIAGQRGNSRSTIAGDVLKLIGDAFNQIEN